MDSDDELFWQALDDFEQTFAPGGPLLEAQRVQEAPFAAPLRAFNGSGPAVGAQAAAAATCGRQTQLVPGQVRHLFSTGQQSNKQQPQTLPAASLEQESVVAGGGSGGASLAEVQVTLLHPPEAHLRQHPDAQTDLQQAHEQQRERWQALVQSPQRQQQQQQREQWENTLQSPQRQQQRQQQRRQAVLQPPGQQEQQLGIAGGGQSTATAKPGISVPAPLAGFDVGAGLTTAASTDRHPRHGQHQQHQQHQQQQDEGSVSAVAGIPTQQQPATCAASNQAASPAAAAPVVPRRSRLRQLFDFLLVMDLEATCDKDKASQPQPQEIIELSCVIVDTATLSLRTATFQRYVRPDQHPRLSAFCTQLTGITQDMVDGGVPLRAALQDLDAWLREEGLVGQGKTFVPVTWRDWDLKVQMAMECKWRRIEQPKWQKRWVDLSAVWVKHSNKKGNLRASVEAAGLQWDGRAHSAIDDARNTARLAIKLMQAGVILGVTGSFTGVDASGRYKQATLFASCSSGKAGSGAGSKSGGAGGFVGQQPPVLKKRKVFDEAGAWNGCCYCGARAKKRQVKKPGPNNGREFWSCGKFSMTGGGAVCDFFKFCSELAAPAEPPASKGGRGGKWH